MKVAFFHGLESDGPGQKGAYLKTVASTLYAPVVNYYDPADVRRVWNEVLEFGPDVVVGSSMGGWFGLHVCMELNVVGAFVNPAVVGRSLELELELKKEVVPPLFLLLGLQDDKVPPQKVREWMEEHQLPVGIDFEAAGHRIPIASFQSWWESISAQLSTLGRFESSSVQKLLVSELKLGRPELALAEAVLRRFPTLDALCGYSGGGLPHGQESAERRWLADLDEMESGLAAMERKIQINQQELRELRQHLGENEQALDWADPRIRKAMLKSLRSITSVGSIRRTVYPHEHSRKEMAAKWLPKLTPVSYHRMIAFFKSEVNVLGRDRGSTKWDPVEDLIQHRIEWMGIDLSAPGAPHPRSLRNCRLMIVPKHIDGNATYAVTFEQGIMHHLIRNLHFWIPNGEGGWVYDGMQRGKLK